MILQLRASLKSSPGGSQQDSGVSPALAVSIACHPKPPFGNLAPSQVPYSSCLLSAGIWAGALLLSVGTPSFPPFLYWRTFCHLCPSLQREVCPQWRVSWLLPLLLAGSNTQKKERILCFRQECESVFCGVKMFPGLLTVLRCQKTPGPYTPKSWLDFLALTDICLVALPKKKPDSHWF